MLPNPLPMPGSNEQGPTAVHVIWVNQKAFRLQWCQKCRFHRPPRTYHCRLCNICVEVSAPLDCPPANPLPPSSTLVWTRRLTHTRAIGSYGTISRSAKGRGSL